MSNLAELAQAYEGRTALAAAWTDDQDDFPADAWAALRALLGEGNVAGTTLASKVLFRADAGAPLYTISLDRYGRAIGVEVAS